MPEKDHTLKGAIERYLEVALECTIDIGEMIISREKLKRPETGAPAAGFQGRPSPMHGARI